MIKREDDEHQWLSETADYVKGLNLPQLSETGLYDYLVEMGGSERRALESQVTRLLLHLLKFRYQPEKASNSWRHSVRDARNEIRIIVKNSPSLKRKLAEFLQDDDVYEAARDGAEDETGVEMPNTNPFTAEEILSKEFFG